MDSESVRRSPRRHIASQPLRSRYSLKTATELREDLAAAGVHTSASAKKQQLFELWSQLPGNCDQQDKDLVSMNGSSPDMIPMSMSAEERQQYQRQDSSCKASPATSRVSANYDSLVLWRSPISTMYFFLAECYYQFGELLKYLASRWQFAAVFGLLSAVFTIASVIEGPHTPAIVSLRQGCLWYGWWVGLGILSSVGLGTGLHTFLLYLGPHIAAVTLAAWSCMSVDFPEPPYPDELQCPEGAPAAGAVMTIWMIISKVRWEAMAWGAGTAIGELPPYFVARAARLAGQQMDPELEEAMNTADTSIAGRAKNFVHSLIQRVGFWGIFLAASIPNPLFDLAGITCGHFLVPFPTFFGATLLGKAVVKMHLQKVLVVFLFTKSTFEWLIEKIGEVPSIGSGLQKPFLEFLEKQKNKYHRKDDGVTGDNTSLIQYLYGVLVMGMIAYFALSIVHSLAKQNAARRAAEKDQ